MALRPVYDGDQESMVRTLNENFRDIDNMFRVIRIKDETGLNRILIGKLPDDTYGIVISKEGEDVLDAFS